MANKVAFNKNYKDDVLDLWGLIGDIKDPYNCSQIVLQVDGGNYYKKITCTNCPENKDNWCDEVLKVAVGDTIHVRRRYDDNSSSEDELVLYKCHIIK